MSRLKFFITDDIISSNVYPPLRDWPCGGASATW